MKSICLALLALIGLPATPTDRDSIVNESPHLIDIADQERRWHPVNDGVMGGISRSGMQITEQGTALFSGQLSLENNGGFASVRTPLAPRDLSNLAGVEITVRGDGRTYQLRFRTDERFDGAAYRALIPTRPGEWVTIRLPFTDFQPTFRGRILAGYGPLDTNSLCQLTFMIADKQAGPFQLEIQRVGTFAVKPQDKEE